MNHLKLSIITPVYNGERFIEPCIKNVIAQNCPHIEHIIVDGNSKDRTVEIIKQYAKRYQHIVWISEKDKGQSDAMNKGIAVARGEIISFLNDDDFYEPNVFNRVIEIFKTLPESSLLVGNCNIRSEDGTIEAVNKSSKMKLSDLLLGILVNPVPLNPTAYFYHKSLHKKVGLYKIMYYAMDVDFLMRAVQVAKIKYVNETWGNSVLREHSKTGREMKSGKSYMRHQSIIRSYRKDLPFFKRLIVTIKYELYYKEKIGIIKTKYNRFKYYAKNIQKIPTMIKRKINNRFGVRK